MKKLLLILIFIFILSPSAIARNIYGEYSLSFYNNFKKGFPLSTFLRNHSITLGYNLSGMKIYGQYNWLSHVDGSRSDHYYSPVVVGVEARTNYGGYDLYYVRNFVNKTGENDETFLRLQYIRTLGKFPLIMRWTHDWYLTKKEYKTTGGFSYYRFLGKENIFMINYKFNDTLEDFLGLLNPWVISYYRNIRDKINLEFKYSPRKENHILKCALRVSF